MSKDWTQVSIDRNAMHPSTSALQMHSREGCNLPAFLQTHSQGRPDQSRTTVPDVLSRNLEVGASETANMCCVGGCVGECMRHECILYINYDAQYLGLVSLSLQAHAHEAICTHACLI